jgi:hypothetical protein
LRVRNRFRFAGFTRLPREEITCFLHYTKH